MCVVIRLLMWNVMMTVLNVIHTKTNLFCNSPIEIRTIHLEISYTYAIFVLPKKISKSKLIASICELLFQWKAIVQTKALMLNFVQYLIPPFILFLGGGGGGAHNFAVAYQVHSYMLHISFIPTRYTEIFVIVLISDVTLL